MSSLIQQYGGRRLSGTFNATSTAGLVLTRALTLLAAQLPNVANALPEYDAVTGVLLKSPIWGFCITNNSTDTLYLGFTGANAVANTVTATNNYRLLPPNTATSVSFYEVSASAAVLNALQILSTGATSACTLTIFY